MPPYTWPTKPKDWPVLTSPKAVANKSLAQANKPQFPQAVNTVSRNPVRPTVNDLNQKFPHIKVRLFAEDNPLAILGRTIKAMRDAGVGQDEIDTYIKQVTSGGNLKNLLAVTAQWVSTY